MVICPNCGRENPEGFRFCGFCSAPLEAPGGAELRKTVTVLFTDLAGFTPLAERLDPEAVRAIQGRFLQTMKAVVERHGGTVEKFIGDAVMAVFGVPAVHEDDALRAVRAAVEMREELGRLNEGLLREYDLELSAHTGVNTGEVVVAEGASERLATGDAVNVAARLEQAASPGEILIGDETFRLVRAAVIAEPVEPLALKGKRDLVGAYRVVSIDATAPGYLRRLDTPLIGREAELAEVLEVLARARDGRRCGLVTIVGPPGLGKSRLVAEVAARARPEWRVLQGRCLPYGEGITFWPVAEAVKEAAGVTDGDTVEEVVRRIESLLPAEDAERVGPRVAAAIGIGRSDDRSLPETFWALRRVFEVLADAGPLVFVVEDVHWAEPALLDFVEYLVSFATGSPLVVLCTARPEVRETRPDWGRVGATVTLAPLTDAQSQSLIRNLLGSAGFPEEVLGTAVRVAEGNPLFVEELLRKLIDEGVLVRSNGHWESTGPVDTVSAPPTISAVLSARIDALEDGERSTIQRGSVAGRVFYWGAVEALAPEAERTDVGRHLQTLVRKELIAPDQSSFAGEDAFAFGHLLVRDAAYESTPKSVRADLHERFARWLEGAAGERVSEYEEIVGYHLEQAVRYRAEMGLAGEDEELGREAGRRLAAAGHRAQLLGDNAAAANLLERASRLPSPAAPERRAALAALGPVLMEMGRFEDAVAALDEAIALAAQAGDVRLEQLARARRVYVRAHHLVVDDLHARWAEAEEAVGILEGLGEREAAAEALSYLGTGRYFRGDTEGGIRDEERAREHALAAGDVRTATWAGRWLTAMMARGPTPVPEGIRRTRALLEDVPRDGYFEAAIMRQLGALQRLGGENEEARASLGRALDLSRRLGLSVEIGGGLRELAELEIGLGRLPEAQRALREAVEIFTRISDPAHGTSVASMLAGVLAKDGRTDEARRFLDLAADWLSGGDVDGEFEYHVARSGLDLALGDAGSAAAEARAAIEAIAGTGYLEAEATGNLALARALFADDRAEEAAVALEEARDVARKKESASLAQAVERLARAQPTPR